MRSSPRDPARVRVLHPLQWLWEPLEAETTFVLRSMFGAKAVYLDGKLMLCFCHGEEPWHGVLACTDRPHHAALMAELPALTSHPVLPKWLYLAADTDAFDRIAPRLVALAGRRDPRLGVAPRPKRKPRNSPRPR